MLDKKLFLPIGLLSFTAASVLGRFCGDGPLVVFLSGLCMGLASVMILAFLFTALKSKAA
jgi:uncharacterized membrane protein YuzA (DUF378 family)